MKRLWLWVFLLCLPWQAVAVNITADQQASCNASFHEGCKSDQTFTTTSSGFAAPMGVLGSSGPESALVALVIAGGIGRGLYRARAGRGRKGKAPTPVGQPGSGGPGATRQEEGPGEGPC